MRKPAHSSHENNRLSYTEKPGSVEYLQPLETLFIPVGICWTPKKLGGIVEAIRITARDVTDIRKLQQEANR